MKSMEIGIQTFSGKTKLTKGKKAGEKQRDKIIVWLNLRDNGKAMLNCIRRRG